MKTILICLIIPALCAAQTCMMMAGDTSSNVCTPNAYGGCTKCADGYQKFNNMCYAPCPSGWTQLIPGYCINSTIIQEHQNFTLCPTDENVEMTAGAGQFLCSTQNTGGCQCAPNCPSGYTSVGCQCVYGSVLASFEDSHSWLYVFSAVGLLAIILGVGYLVKKYVISSQAKIPLQSQTNVNSKYIEIIESK